MVSRIAVIMSLYRNDSIEFVTLAVESILNQSYTDFDLYIQYDGPIKDEVDAYLSHLNDERIHIYKRLENKGLAQSLNDLLKIVKPLEYDYIVIAVEREYFICVVSSTISSKSNISL